MNNSVIVIAPYYKHGVWMFTDPRTGLVDEPFVGEINTFIDKLVDGIPNARYGFRLTFSAVAFPTYELSFKLLNTDPSGSWYHCNEFDADGWLCPALFRYFPEAPENLYVSAGSL